MSNAGPYTTLLTFSVAWNTSLCEKAWPVKAAKHLVLT